MMAVQWNIVDRDESQGGPDFLVYHGSNAFGLEVQEVFAGEISLKKGSRRKQRQAGTQKRIDEIRRRYEESEEGVALDVKFVGTLNDIDIEMVVQALLKFNLNERSSLNVKRLELRQISRDLKLYVRRLPVGWPRDRLGRPDWFSVMDSSGLGEQDSRKILDAVSKKSKKISQYRRNIVDELNLVDPEEADVRLLLYADRMWSYGQIAPRGELAGNLHGFTVVYFFPFPEKPDHHGIGLTRTTSKKNSSSNVVSPFDVEWGIAGVRLQRG